MPRKDAEKRKEYERARPSRAAYHRARRLIKGAEDGAKRAPKKREYDKTRRAQKRQYWWKVRGISEPTRPEAEWCECCGRLPEKTLHLDHDHRTGKFRGWICQQCNHALGLLGDDLASIEKAAEYLKRAQ